MIITRHGRPIAAVVPIDVLTRLRAGVAASSGQGLVAVAGGWEGSDDLAAAVARVRRR